MKKNFSILVALCLSACSLVAQTNELAVSNMSNMFSEDALTEMHGESREASFPGGWDALRNYLADHFQYSDKAVENELEGIVKL